MADSKLNILIVTTTRADWGILSSPARVLALNPGVNLTVLAGNMHTSTRYGHTVDEIEAEGLFNVIRAVCPEVDGSPRSRSDITAAMTRATARAISSLQPHAVVILGDRYEMLGAASAALIAGVPIVHLHGGETSIGAIDDSVRNAISAMASLHLAATPLAARRLMAMGHDPRSVVVTGAIGVENAMNVSPMSVSELSRSLGGFDIDPSRTLLVTFHPVTRHPQRIPGADQIEALLGALDDNPAFNAIITAPNNDPGSIPLMERLRAYADAHPERVCFVPSLGKVRYLSALRCVRAVVGNSSSGILEAPSTTADTIDIGPRQEGRERAESVVHTPDSRPQIARAIAALAHTRRRNPDPSANPYFRPDACATAVKAILDFLHEKIRT